MKPKIIKIIFIVWIVAGLLFIVNVGISYQAKNIPDSVFKSTEDTQVKITGDYILFEPLTPYQKVFIFYPGALVDPKAYAPLCRKIADKGHKSLIIKMPFRFAGYGYKKPIELGLLRDSTKEYILAGHSKGAMTAAQFIYEYPNLIDKLVLIGTTHPRDFDISGSKVQIMKIYGSNDGVATVNAINKNKRLLPPSTKFIEITGGNHSQFGYYGSQLGDNKPGINIVKQQDILCKHILSFIE